MKIWIIEVSRTTTTQLQKLGTYQDTGIWEIHVVSGGVEISGRDGKVIDNIYRQSLEEFRNRNGLTCSKPRTVLPPWPRISKTSSGKLQPSKIWRSMLCTEHGLYANKIYNEEKAVILEETNIPRRNRGKIGFH